jgi:UPF0176 protein
MNKLALNLKKKKKLIFSFYRFTKIRKKEKLKELIYESIKNKNLRGTILLADEGINGSIAGEKQNLLKILRIIRTQLNIRNLNIKVNEVDFLPFNRFKVRLKKEIVSLGKGEFNYKTLNKTYIHPAKWNNLISKKNLNLIDVRNIYETSIGKFNKAIDPETNSFRELPDKIKKLQIKKDENIALYCTGGIRCEKATAYLKKNGYQNVFQLQGGILSYLEYTSKNKLKSLWGGECFVFDNRVTVNKKLNKGKYDQCYGCRHPISEIETNSKYYKKGVYCPHCFDKRTDDQKKRSLMRQKQILLNKEKAIENIFTKN